MIKIRLIPVLLLKDRKLVRSEDFLKHNIIGDPFHEVVRFNEWNVDELIYLIINNLSVEDKKNKKQITLLNKISESCFMPLTFGGQIRTIQDVYDRFQNGADKITLNTIMYENPGLLKETSKIFGKQAIVGSIDYKFVEGSYKVFVDGGKTATNIDPFEWTKEIEKLGVGEILLQNIDRDGTGKGYDIDTLSKVCSLTSIPVIALGGVGKYEHYIDAVKAGASAVSSANIWHFKEMADYFGKLILKENSIPVRMDR